MNKRKVVVFSDSDDDLAAPSRKQHTTPSKSTKKRSRIALSSDSDESPVKSKATKHKTKKPKDDYDIELSDEDELVLGTDEKKKRKGKKELPPGQKTLNFSKTPSSSISDDKSKKKKEVSHVNPADFFKPVPRNAKKPTEIKAESPKKKKPETDISPSQKENASSKQKPQAKAGDDDEFVDSDDSFESFVPASKKTSPERKTEKVKQEAKAHKKIESPKKEIKVPKITPKSSQESTSSKDSGFASQEVVIKKEKTVDPELPWVDKYKPKGLSQLVGQSSEKSPMNKLLDWLKDWAKNNLGEGGKVKKPKPMMYMSQQDGTAFKAALLSGSPGVGKTTCAYMACETLGFKLVEMNASDVRNKKHLEAKIGELTGSHQIEEFFGGKKAVAQDNLKVHHVLIMDEVDGMSGNEDRAGVSELIQIIKETKIPIICICNDRMHPKIRSLANYCFDLRFYKPKVESIRARMMTICAIEKLKIPKEEIDEIIEMSQFDVRQTIYNLQIRSTGTGTSVNKKDIAWGPFDAAKQLLDPSTSLIEKQQMFFVDYGIMPLFVQENYLRVKNEKNSPLKAIGALRKASNLISFGDTIDRHIRGGGAWKLLNEQSMISAALPAMVLNGHLRGRMEFPSWLGRNSTAGKKRRLLQQLVMHTHLKVSSNMHSFATDYAPILRTRITQPLIDRESDGIPDVIETMTEYDLIKDDSEALSEIAVWPGKIDPASKILSKVKSALTRTMNKTARMLPYSTDETSKGKKRGVNMIGFEMDEEGNLVEAYEDDGDDDEDDNSKTSSEIVIKPAVSSSTRGKGTASKRGGTRGGRGRGSKK